MTTSTETKKSKLREIISPLEGAAVAFSGGVDSSLLLAVAHECLGDRVTAVTVATPLAPAGEMESARRFAGARGIRHEIIMVDLLAIPAVACNPPDRCYHCKKAIFTLIVEFASAHGITHVLEGTNLDDENDHRPGMRALTELGVMSPLRDAGLGKAAVRSLARVTGIDSWNRPAGPCLATRIPFGTPITRGALERIDAAERRLRAMGFHEVRVRCHGDLARIEVPAADIGRFMDPRIAEHAVRGVRDAGFAFVSLDLEGYRCGSMDAAAAEGPHGQG